LTIATLVQAKDVIGESSMIIPLIIGTISAVVFSLLSIKWLLNFLKSQSTWIFVWYRLGFATFLLAAISQKWL
jgi:undecaprenyl-diphosphatase